MMVQEQRDQEITEHEVTLSQDDRQPPRTSAEMLAGLQRVQARHSHQ